MTIEDSIKKFYIEYEDIDIDVTTTLLEHSYIIHLDYFPPNNYHDDIYYGYSVKLTVDPKTEPNILYNKLLKCREYLINLYKERNK